MQVDRTSKYLGLAVIFLVALVLSARSKMRVAIGTARDAVVEEYGEPVGSFRKGEIEVLFYDAGSIDILDGKVVRVDPAIAAETDDTEVLVFGVETRPRRRVSRGNELSAEQFKVKRAPKKGKARTRSTKAVWTISNEGKKVDLRRLLVPGSVTVVDLYAEWSLESADLGAQLAELAEKDEDVFLRRVNIVRDDSELARQFGLETVPHVRVYNRKGRLVGSPASDWETVSGYIEDAR